MKKLYTDHFSPSFYLKPCVFYGVHILRSWECTALFGHATKQPIFHFPRQALQVVISLKEQLSKISFSYVTV